MTKDVLASRGNLRIVGGEVIGGRGIVQLVWMGDRGAAWEGGIVLSAADLRWLITTGGPAALHAIGAAPKLKLPGLPTPPDGDAA